jgi:type I restriction enzyme M protein
LHLIFELTKRHKLNLDISSWPAVCLAHFPAARIWLKDESLEDSANLPEPAIIAAEIVEDLQAALAQFAEIAADLKK